jgi:hypothetical protein
MPTISFTSTFLHLDYAALALLHHARANERCEKISKEKVSLIIDFIRCAGHVIPTGATYAYRDSSNTGGWKYIS